METKRGQESLDIRKDTRKDMRKVRWKRTMTRLLKNFDYITLQYLVDALENI